MHTHSVRSPKTAPFSPAAAFLSAVHNSSIAVPFFGAAVSSFPLNMRLLFAAALLGVAAAQCTGTTCATCAAQGSSATPCTWCETPQYPAADSPGTCSQLSSACSSGQLALKSPYAVSSSSYVNGGLLCPASGSTSRMCSSYSTCTSCATQNDCRWVTTPGGSSYCTAYAGTYGDGIQPAYPNTVILSCNCPGSSCSAYDAASLVLASWIIAAIVIGLLLFVVLPIAVVVAICVFGVSCCRYNNRRRADGILVQIGPSGSPVFVQENPQMMMVNEDPTYMLNPAPKSDDV